VGWRGRVDARPDARQFWQRDRLWEHHGGIRQSTIPDRLEDEGVHGRAVVVAGSCVSVRWPAFVPVILRVARGMRVKHGMRVRGVPRGVELEYMKVGMGRTDERHEERERRHARSEAVHHRSPIMTTGFRRVKAQALNGLLRKRRVRARVRSPPGTIVLER